MQLFDPEAELRRAAQYTDVSCMVFVVTVTALLLVAGFAIMCHLHA